MSKTLRQILPAYTPRILLALTSLVGPLRAEVLYAPPFGVETRAPATVAATAQPVGGIEVRVLSRIHGGWMQPRVDFHPSLPRAGTDWARGAAELIWYRALASGRAPAQTRGARAWLRRSWQGEGSRLPWGRMATTHPGRMQELVQSLEASPGLPRRLRARGKGPEQMVQAVQDQALGGALAFLPAQAQSPERWMVLTGIEAVEVRQGAKSQRLERWVFQVPGQPRPLELYRRAKDPGFHPRPFLGEPPAKGLRLRGGSFAKLLEGELLRAITESLGRRVLPAKASGAQVVRGRVDRSHATFVQPSPRPGFYQGTQWGPKGLSLAPGTQQGVYVSPRLPLPKGFPSMTVGLVQTTPQGAQVRVSIRGFNAQGQALGGFRPVDREAQVAFAVAAAFIQLMVQLESGGAGGPNFQAVTLTPLGMPLRQPPASSAGSAPGRGSWLPFTPQGSPRAPVVQAPLNKSGGILPTAKPTQLNFVSRSQWGAVEDSRTRGIGGHQPTSITLHHSEGATGSGARGRDLVKGIQSFHRGSQRGWSDVGYHYLIAADGVVYEGRPLNKIGAHSPPNRGRVGICVLGNFQNQDPTPTQLGAIQALVNWLRQGPMPAQAKVTAHRDQRSTDCPGARLAPFVAQLNR